MKTFKARHPRIVKYWPRMWRIASFAAGLGLLWLAAVAFGLAFLGFEAQATCTLGLNIFSVAATSYVGVFVLAGSLFASLPFAHKRRQLIRMVSVVVPVVEVWLLSVYALNCLAS